MINNRKINFKDLSRSFKLVQSELEEIGLWKQDKYLWNIDLQQSVLPSFWGEMGYVYDSGVPLWDKALGYNEGVIYIPSYAPVDAYVPGGTLVDTIRHEFGHAWAWYDSDLFAKKWFRDTFDLDYGDEWEFGKDLYKLFSKYEDKAFQYSPYYENFVSSYALFAPYEDFAETFMYYLKYRKSLKQFKNRKGVYNKLMAIHKVVKSVKKIV